MITFPGNAYEPLRFLAGPEVIGATLVKLNQFANGLASQLPQTNHILGVRRDYRQSLLLLVCWMNLPHITHYNWHNFRRSTNHQGKTSWHVSYPTSMTTSRPSLPTHVATAGPRYGQLRLDVWRMAAAVKNSTISHYFFSNMSQQLCESELGHKS